MKTSELIRTLAIKYERYKDQLGGIPAHEIEQYRLDVHTAFNRVTSLVGGIKVVYVSGQPYKGLEDMTSDITVTGCMNVSTEFNDSKLLPGVLNLQFRAVHDYLHYLFQQPFGFSGELNVYKCQKYMHLTEAGKRILYSEVVMQAAYCEYFGKFADGQKVIIN